MPIEVGIWRIDGDPVRRVNAARLKAEKRLEDVLEEDISILGLGPLLVLGRQVATDFGTFIDLLAIDSDGVLHVIELKRDKAPRNIVAQVLDYGSWVTNLGAERIAAIFEQGRFANGRTFADAFREQFQVELPETINESHRLTIVASEVGASIERIVDYLLERFGVPINAVFFSYFQDGDAEYLAGSWLRSTSEPETRAAATSKRTQPPWNGIDFYVTFGEGETRDWEDAREYGFVSAGGSPKYWKPLRSLVPGHRVFAYLPERGYAGVGWVTDTLKPSLEFTVTLENGDTVPVLEAPLRAPNARRWADDPDKAEYFVRVEWDEETVPREQAYFERDMFTNATTVCKLSDRATLEKLYEHFGQDAAGAGQDGTD
jgi:hypothetical protein